MRGSLAALFGLDCECITVWAAVGTLAVFGTFLSLGPARALAVKTKRQPPEGFRLWGLYDADRVREYLVDAGENGRELYLLQLKLDFVFLILWGWGLAFLIDGTFVRQLAEPGNLAWIALLPAVAAIADLLEDVSLLMALKGGGAAGQRPIGAEWVPRAALATLVKWWAVTASAILIAYGSISLAVQGSA